MRRPCPFSQSERAIGRTYTLVSVRRLVWLLVLVAVLALPAGAWAGLSSSLKRQIRGAGTYSGALVVDASTGKTLFAWKAGIPRVLASNVKLFTTASALDRFGVDGTFSTDVLSDTPMNADGVVAGDVWLRGGGDPAFGTLAYVRKYYGPSASSVELLVDQLAQLGLTAVRGGIHGDESRFDTIRGVHDSAFRTSPWIGPLSALTLNHGYDGRRFQSSPASFAAGVFRKTLKADGITPGHAAASAKAPADASIIASVKSPPMSELVRLTNKDSDNFFAETLLKNIGEDAGGAGTTSAGVNAVRSFASSVGATVSLIDGSGLDHGNRAAPRDVVRLLVAERSRPEYDAFYNSLPIAGVDGTIHKRMRSAPARGNCRAKTGSLIGVSGLSGYCTTRSGREVAFSFLMNGVSTYYARRIQDRMTQAVAGS
jgi:D-alanyl-D-alanine carboxypeptidase/D-alanyl-D-alanine-endopeptidase (penicillin-binding protein 4)